MIYAFLTEGASEEAREQFDDAIARITGTFATKATSKVANKVQARQERDALAGIMNIPGVAS